MSLEDQVHRIVQDFSLLATEVNRTPPDTYSGAFIESSIRKARDVLESINRCDIEHQKIVYVSIGCSECYEIEYILKHSDIARFLAFDLSHKACETAWDRLFPIIPPR